MTKNDTDINSKLTEVYVTPESVFDKKRTKTSHFLLNMIFPNTSITQIEFFQNAYLNDALANHEIERPILVLFKFNTLDSKWQVVAQKLRKKPEYRFEYFVGIQDDKNLLMMVFQAPERFKVDYEHFRMGKYSKFSKEYKKLFREFVTNEKGASDKSIIWKVVHKSPELKRELEEYFNPVSTRKVGVPLVFDEGDELWGLPEPMFEIYRYKPKQDESRTTI